MSLLRPEVGVLADNYYLDPPEWGIVGPRVDIPSWWVNHVDDQPLAKIG